MSFGFMSPIDCIFQIGLSMINARVCELFNDEEGQLDWIFDAHFLVEVDATLTVAELKKTGCLVEPSYLTLYPELRSTWERVIEENTDHVFPEKEFVDVFPEDESIPF